MDRETFARRVLGCESKLYHVACAILAGENDAQDAVQDALVRAWKARDSLREEAYFETWLTRILINVCKAYRRRKPSLPLDERWRAPEREDTGLREALSALPEKYRLPLVLRYAEDMELANVAAALKLPVGAVKWRINKGKTLLEAQLKGEWTH